MTQPTYEQLWVENRQLKAENAQLRQRVVGLEAQVEQLQTQVRQLTAQLQEALRAHKRQAAPFSKGPPKDPPATPGRKAGEHYGPKAHREIPRRAPDEILDLPLPRACPDCGGPTREDRQAQQFQTEIPRRPLYRRFDIHIGHCLRCGRRIQPRHPLQTSDALGAAASQLGPDAQAAIVHLNKHAGLSQGKIADYFRTLFGIVLAPSGVCQVLLRAARRCEDLYQRITDSLPQAPWIVPDETGWRIGGTLAWMHGFVTACATVYHVARRRGYEVAEGFIGTHYAGLLIHDGWAPYDRFVWAGHQQCLDHLRRRCLELLQTARGRAALFPRQVRQLLTDALTLRDRRDAGQLSAHGLAVTRGRLEARLGRLLYWPKTQPDNERLAKHLDKHRQDLFTFLKVPGLDATNYRAEQAMRPAAVNRKVWGGNRTAAGAHAQSVLMTVLATCRQQARDSLGVVADILRGRRVRLRLLPSGP
jgi:transposase